MPFVNEIEEAQADAHLRGIYGKIEQKIGIPSALLQGAGADAGGHRSAIAIERRR